MSCAVHLSELNGSGVFDKQPVHPRPPFIEDLVDAAAAGRIATHVHFRADTRTHTHIAHCCVLWGALWSPKAQPTAHVAVTHLWLCPSALPASPPNTHVNTVIGRPHVPVNLLMRRHGLRRVLLLPRGWPDLSACQFYSLPRWLLDGLPHLID